MIDLQRERTELILGHYGTKEQVLKALEELTELGKELWQLHKENAGNICGVVASTATKTCILCEMADVLVMLGQLQTICGITDKDLQVMVEYKIDRTMDRIRNNEQ